jgi:hypothetical protein
MTTAYRIVAPRMRVVRHDLDLEHMLVGASDQTLETAREERGRVEE